jgi:hypothetical protein
MTTYRFWKFTPEEIMRTVVQMLVLKVSFNRWRRHSSLQNFLTTTLKSTNILTAENSEVLFTKYT